MDTSKKAVEALINKFVVEKINRGDPSAYPPILISDALEAMGKKDLLFYRDDCFTNESRLCSLWQEVGFTKSLQSIAEEDTPEGKNLFEFLITIF